MTSEERVKVVNDIDDILGDWTNSGDDFYLQQAMAAIQSELVTNLHRLPDWMLAQMSLLIFAAARC